jgi:hypothetical protein
MGVDAAVEDEARAVDGLRTTVRWIASAFGAIPTIAALTAIIRAPGERGFETWELCVGIGLAAAGGIIAVVAFAWVLAPAAVKDGDFDKNFDMGRVPGSGYRYSSFAAMKDALVAIAGGVANEEAAARLAQRRALVKKERATAAEELADQAEADVKKNPGDKSKEARANQLREDADAKALEAGAAAATSASALNRFAEWSIQLQRLERVRADAYRIRAYDRIKTRFVVALVAAGVSIVLVATGIALLALAPKAKTTKSAATTPALLTLTLNGDGRKAVNCPGVQSLLAIKVGGTAAQPLVITFPRGACDAKTILFTTKTGKKGKPKPLGTVTTTRTITAPTAP